MIRRCGDCSHTFSDLPNWDSPSAMQVYSLRHPNAPAKRTQAGQRVCTAVQSLCPCRIWRVRPIVQCQPTEGSTKKRVATPMPTHSTGARDMEKSPRARSPRCRAIAKQSGRPVSRLGSLRRCRATLQAGAGVNTRAEGEYPQFLDKNGSHADRLIPVRSE